jgi:pimeloyl-ACP methyl ester carboxylesterase
MVKTADLGGPVSYIDHGGEGAPLLFVHGLAGAVQNWSLVATEIAASGYRAYSLDLLGFGATPLAGRQSTLEQNRDLIRDFIKFMDQGPVILVGHSMGGLLAMLLAISDPGLITKLVLLDPAVPGEGPSSMEPIPKGFVDWIADRPRLGAAIAGFLATIEGPERLVKDALKQYCADSSTLDPGLVAAIVAGEKERIAKGHAYLGYMQAYRSMTARLRDQGAYDRDIVMGIKAPTLFIAGSKDTLVPIAHLRRVAKLRPDWTYEEMEGVGHNPQMEAPSSFRRVLLDWLGASVPTPTLK